MGKNRWKAIGTIMQDQRQPQLWAFMGVPPNRFKRKHAMLWSVRDPGKSGEY
jgi:hypothetical protein